MKQLVWLAILGALAYFGYIHLIQTSSPEESSVRSLEKEFQRATDRYISAMRQAGEPGIVILATRRRPREWSRMSGQAPGIAENADQCESHRPRPETRKPDPDLLRTQPDRLIPFCRSPLIHPGSAGRQMT